MLSFFELCFHVLSWKIINPSWYSLFSLVSKLQKVFYSGWCWNGSILINWDLVSFKNNSNEIPLYHRLIWPPTYMHARTHTHTHTHTHTNTQTHTHTHIHNHTHTQRKTLNTQKKKRNKKNYMKLKNTSNSQTHVNSFIFSTKTFLKYIHYVLKCCSITNNMQLIKIP